MSWISPVENVNYQRSAKSGVSYALTKAQRNEIKEALKGLRSRTRKRAEVIRDLSIRMGVYEGTIRRAAYR